MISKPHEVLPWYCCSWGSIGPTPRKEASWFSQAHIRHTMSPAVSACSKPNYKTTGFDRNSPHCSQPQPRLWQCKCYMRCRWMGLRKCKWPGEVCPGKLCAPPLSPELPRDGSREPAKAAGPPTPCCHAHLNHHQLQISYVTQCPLRLANTSSPDLIFPEIWLMLALPPKKGCQIKRENMISLVRTGREPSTVTQQGRSATCLISTISRERQNEF